MEGKTNHELIKDALSDVQTFMDRQTIGEWAYDEAKKAVESLWLIEKEIRNLRTDFSREEQIRRA